MLKKIGLALLAIVALFLLIVSLQPAELRIARSTTMAATPERVFGEVNDLHKWEGWSPWAKLDPAAKNTFEGPESGKGAIFSWDGNDQVGAGRMTITESRPSELVGIRLDFTRPMQCTNDVAFTFEPKDQQTAVTWTMTGQKNFMAKAVGLFMDMDKMVGGDFEKGLANLKEIVEKESPQ